MSEFLDFDPLTGITHWFDHDEMTNMSSITYTQDVEPILDFAAVHRNDSLTDGGIKEDWWKYAIVPAIVQVKLRAKGIDINDPGATKRIIQEINEHYPKLKMTQKNHDGIARKLYMPSDAK
jgi:hypothetical protein